MYSLIVRLRDLNRENKLSNDEKKIIAELGAMPSKKSLEERFEVLVAYYNQYGTIENVATDEQFEHNGTIYNIGRQIMSLRAKHTANRLKQDVVEFLESMGIVWRKRDARMSFADKIEVLSTYTQQTNKTLAEVKGDEIFKFEGRNIQISKWLTLFRMAYNNGELSPRQIDELENLGIMWDGIKTRHNLHFNTLVEVLEQYASEHGGSIRNAKKNEAYYYNGEKFPLKDIVYRLQGRYAEILTDEQKSRLTAIGLVFIDYRDYKIEVLQQYCNQFGSIEDIII
ncbi:MAG: helicase associated domain-containing protein, partial [Clostridia bacterium]|nr:helicase associated domain-containing protein [Clostridia bacterium]